MGNILQLKQTAGNTFTRNFQYNNLNANNLLHSIKKADNTTNYATFTYNANGNKLTAGTERKYLWGHADQLKAYVNQAGTGEPSVYAQYLYSGGQRVKKLVRTSGGGTETTVYIDGVFEHKYNGTNSQSIMKVGGVATVRTGYAFDGLSGTSYELSNHLGSVSIRLDGSGSTIDIEEYYPFGDSSVRTWSGKRYRYVGKEKDQESGLYYYGARYYSAWTCRFISVDPLAGDYPQLTSYNYASNAPINSLDIDGMQNPDEPKGGGGKAEFAETLPGAPSKPADGQQHRYNSVDGNTWSGTWDTGEGKWELKGTDEVKLNGVDIFPKYSFKDKFKSFSKGLLVGLAFIAAAAAVAIVIGPMVLAGALALGLSAATMAAIGTAATYAGGAVLAYSSFQSLRSRDMMNRKISQKEAAYNLGFGASSLMGGPIAKGLSKWMTKVVKPGLAGKAGAVDDLATAGSSTDDLATAGSNIDDVPGSAVVGEGAARGSKAIVIGEGMGAVKTTAKTLQSQGINAKWYQAWSKNFPTNRLMTPAELSAAQARDARWLNAKINQGYKIYDIGIDATRATRSPFYQLERSILQQRGYPTTIIPR
jgi:RHS repeat-associated protein